MNVGSGSYTQSYDMVLGQWYNLAFVRTSGQLKFFVDGTQQGSDQASTDSIAVSTSLFIGGRTANGRYMNAYMDQIRISNSARYTSAYTPSTTPFTTDANTKLLVKSDFSEGGLGADHSGNYNYFTPTNLGVHDMMLDSPTNNFATWNAVLPIASSATLSEGNLEFDNASGTHRMVFSTIPFQSGKWYAEILCKDRGGEWPALGVSSTGASQYYPESYMGEGTRQYAYLADGRKEVDQAWSTYGNTWTDGDIIGIAIDFDNRYIYYSKNGTWQDSGDPTSGGSGTGAGGAINADVDELVFAMSCIQSGTTEYVLNHGSDSSFAGEKTAQGNQDENDKGDFYYAPPSGFLALCTDNLSTPSISGVEAGENFNTTLYTGTGSIQSITGVGFQPDFVWLKKRNAVQSNGVFDSVRGVYKVIGTDHTNVEGTNTNMLTAFGSDGFTLGTDSELNSNTNTFVSWNWLGGGAAVDNDDGTIDDALVSANTDAGFSIVSYTGNGLADQTVGHGLSVKPELKIIKSRSIVENWVVTGEILGGADYRMFLNLNSANGTATGYYPADTSTTLGISGSSVSNGHNQSSATYIAYCFHSVEGYSKVGSYEGNNNADGAFIYTGMRPAFIMAKRTSATEDWVIMDNKRNTYNWVGARLYPDLTNAEGSSETIDFVSNGFKMRSTNSITNAASTYIYLAFAESPFKTSNAR
jgi:hypothetical protein